MEVHKIPVLSTAHITQQCDQWLSQSNNPIAPMKGPYGYLIHLWSEGSDVPQCMLDIHAWLKKKGFVSLRVILDPDADTVPNLPIYDW